MLRLSEIFSKSGESGGILGGFGSIFTSPIWAAVICVGIMLIIVWSIIHNEVEPIYEDTSIFTLMVKIGVWGLIATAGILYISHSAIEARIVQKYKNKNQEQVVARVLEASEPDNTELKPLIEPRKS